MTAVDDVLFFRNASGVLQTWSTTSGISQTFTNRPIDILSDMESYNEYIWYVRFGHMTRLDLIANQEYSEWSTSNAKGRFSINPATGVVYFVNNSNMMSQLYFSGDRNKWSQYQVGTISNIVTNSRILFSNPNVFYTANDGKVWDLFYFLSDCNSVIFRYKVEENGPESYLNKAELTKDTELSFSVFPQPASSQCTIRYNLKENQGVKLEIVTLNGTVLYETKLPEGNGKHEYPISLPKISSGIYMARLISETGFSTAQKIMIH
jgi:hypothetical protein